MTEEECLRLELKTDDPFQLASTVILATGLKYIWENRKQKKPTAVLSMRTELEMATSIRRRSRSRPIKEAGNIMFNVLNNFFPVAV